MLCIRGATIYTPHQVIELGIVMVENGRIHSIGNVSDTPIPPDAEIIDASGQFLVPGFIDLQINGAFGHDFTEKPSTIYEVARDLPRYGVTAFLPTIITSPLETIAEAQSVIQGGAPAGFIGAVPLGLHLEGPFLNPEKKGAHNPNYLKLPALPLIENWSPQTGVRLVTLAPELPDALAVLRALVERGVIISAGHSMASYDQAAAGIDAGIRYGTHLFNAMAAIHHREPGLIGALLADDRVTVGIIPDGEHVHPSLIKLIWSAIGSDRLNLVTDAMAALGMPAGQYRLGDFDVTVTDSTAKLADCTLAGSILSLDSALRHLTAFTGCTLETALPTLTTTPARLLGLSDHKGQIAAGFDADLTLLTSNLSVVRTYVNGELAYWEDSFYVEQYPPVPRNP